MEKRIEWIKTTFSSELSTSCTFGSTAEGAEKASPETNLKGGPNTGGWTGFLELPKLGERITQTTTTIRSL